MVARGFSICDCCQMYCRTSREDGSWVHANGFDLCSRRCADYLDAGLLDGGSKQASERALKLIAKEVVGDANA